METVKKLEVLKPDRVVDLRDAICPHPLNVIRDTIRALDDDAVLLAISDHEPTALENAPRFCERRGYP